jgi:hypothetical protein
VVVAFFLGEPLPNEPYFLSSPPPLSLSLVVLILLL